MSTYIAKLRASLKTKSGELDTIIKTAEDAGRELTEEEFAKVAEIEASVEKTEKSIEIAERAEAAKARLSVPSDEAADTTAADIEQRRIAAQPKVALKQTQKMGLLAMAVAGAEFARRDEGVAVSPLKILSERGWDAYAREVEQVRRARAEVLKVLNVSQNAAGGYLTPDNQSSDIIELLYPVTTFLQGNPRTVSMPNGVYRQPAGASGASAGYRQEGGPVGATEPTFKEISMSAKFLGAMTLMTREMLNFSINGAEAFIMADLRECMSQAMDTAAYYGDGASGEPQGILTYDGITEVTSQDADTPTLVQIDRDMDALELAFLNNNIRNGNWAYVMAPRTKKFIGSRRTGATEDGEFAFPEIRGPGGRWGEHPVLASTQFPINGGSGADESDLALINFSDVLHAMMDDVGFTTSSDATVYINGAWISLFQNNLVALRVLAGHDISLRRDNAVAKLVGAGGAGITWGA